MYKTFGHTVMVPVGLMWLYGLGSEEKLLTPSRANVFIRDRLAYKPHDISMEGFTTDPRCQLMYVQEASSIIIHIITRRVQLLTQYPYTVIPRPSQCLY